MGFGYDVPTVDDDGYRPDIAAFDPQEAFDAALVAALCLELDCADCCKVTAAWTRVAALKSLL